jgi:hypothetical protein
MAGAASDVDCISTTECTMKTPARMRAGAVTVKASVAGKSSEAESGDQYTYE